jgi:pyridoxine 4-dehydrogenase
MTIWRIASMMHQSMISPGTAFLMFRIFRSGFNPLQSSILSEVAVRVDATVALAWLLDRAPSILLIPCTSSLTHLQPRLSSSCWMRR